MQIIALEVEKSETSANDVEPLLKEEAGEVWRLYQEEFIRAIYFRADQPAAVLMLECQDMDEAKDRLAELPLVAAGLISFELIPLQPYPGFSRLFH